MWIVAGMLMADYVTRMKEIYAALRASEDVDQGDVAELAIAILQEEAKDHRTEMIDRQRTQRVSQTRIGDNTLDSAKDWRDDPATAAQKKALQNLGVDFDDELTKGEASELIDQAKSEQTDA